MKNSLLLCLLIQTLVLPLTPIVCQELPEQYNEAVLKILQSSNYSPNILPPSGLPKSPLKLLVNFRLREIEDINDKRMEMKIQISLRLSWIDRRLQYTYTGDKPGFVTMQGDVPYKPWTPDIFINHEKHSIVHNIIRPNYYFNIYPNGTVKLSARVSLTISCFMNLKMFPFDRQTCEIRVLSYAHSLQTLELDWDPLFEEALTRPDEKKISSDHLTQFRLIGREAGRCLSSTGTYGNYSSVYFRLQFQRQLSYYIIQMFVPCVMLVCLTWISFWLGEAVEARLSLTVTVLLTLSTHISGAFQSMPVVSYATAFDFFSAFCLMLGALSIFQAALVFSWTLRNKKKQSEEATRFQIHPQTEFQVEDQEGRTNIMAVLESTLRNRKFPKPVENVAGGNTWKRRMSLHPTAERIDEISKVLFPASLGMFLVLYFGICLYWANAEQSYIGEQNDSTGDLVMCPT